jgi:hypothetical protein
MHFLCTSCVLDCALRFLMIFLLLIKKKKNWMQVLAFTQFYRSLSEKQGVKIQSVMYTSLGNGTNDLPLCFKLSARMHNISFSYLAYSVILQRKTGTDTLQHQQTNW